VDRLFNYYQNYSEDTRLVKDNAHKVEFITTTHVLDKIVNSNSKILDVGAGTGRYSFYFAQKGHSVYALEFVPHNLHIIRDKINILDCDSNIEAEIGDGRDLSRFEDGSFDVVLCMGPLYHLHSVEDRRCCISECLRVLKKDGILALAYINKFASFLYQFKADKSFIKSEECKNLINLGQFNVDGSNNFYFTSPQEVESMVLRYNIEIVANVATDGIGHLFKETVDNFNEKEYQLWMDHHLRTCTEPSILGYSLHALLIGQKL
jgi:2-polyprenyl-3-methyl-5-hydroxy-6-metoxy-1,4-benzoquinol methylase